MLIDVSMFEFTLSKASIIDASTRLSAKKEPKITKTTKKNITITSVYESIKLYIN
jgi:hypothetical protein